MSIDAVSRREIMKLAALFTASGALPLLRSYEARAQEADAPVRIGYLLLRMPRRCWSLMAEDTSKPRVLKLKSR